MITNNLITGVGTACAIDQDGDKINNDISIFHSLIKGELKC
jgi:hypothetical protein